MSKVQAGEVFPSFSLPDQDGVTVKSVDLKGKPFIAYFYPKDDTSGCTAEACEFRDSIPHFKGVKVIGISPDSPRSHKKFAEKYGLNFTLLADESHSLAEQCGVWVEKSMYGKKYMGMERTTFLVGHDGQVVKVWNKVKPQGHAAEVHLALQSIEG